MKPTGYQPISQEEDHARRTHVTLAERPSNLVSRYGDADAALNVIASDVKEQLEAPGAIEATDVELQKYDLVIDQIHKLPETEKELVSQTMQAQLNHMLEEEKSTEDKEGKGHRDHVQPGENKNKIDQVLQSILNCIEVIDNEKTIKKAKLLLNAVTAKKAAYVALGIATTIVAAAATGGTILLACAVVGLALAVSDLAVNMPAEAYGDLKEKYPKIQDAPLSEKISKTAESMMQKPLTLGVSALTLTGSVILLTILFSPALIMTAPITLPVVCSILLVGAAITAVQVYSNYRQEINALNSEIKTLHSVQETINPPKPEPTKGLSEEAKLRVIEVPTATKPNVDSLKHSLHMTKDETTIVQVEKHENRPSFQQSGETPRANPPTPSPLKKIKS